MTSGYSGKPLAEKLGVKPKATIVALGAPSAYRRLLGPLPPGVRIVHEASKENSFVHLFVRERKALEAELKRLRQVLAPAGVLWVSWPKRASRVPTDVTEDVVREVCIPLDLVDVKVCAVDETWSGLKLVIPLRSRPKPSRSGPRPATA